MFSLLYAASYKIGIKALSLRFYEDIKVLPQSFEQSGFGVFGQV
ncbi:MAG: hypothetical protein V7L22_08780 [Nostoc sp.]